MDKQEFTTKINELALEAYCKGQLDLLDSLYEAGVLDVESYLDLTAAILTTITG